MDDYLLYCQGVTALDFDFAVDTVKDAFTETDRPPQVVKELWQVTSETDPNETPVEMTITLKNGKYAGLEVLARIEYDERSGLTRMIFGYGGRTEGFFMRYLNILRREFENLELRLLEMDSSLEWGH